MKIHSSWHNKHQFIGSSVLLFMFLVLTGCSGIGGSSGSATPTVGSNTSNTAGNGSTATASQTPVIRLGTQPCPEAVKDPAHWTAIIAPTTSAKVESVSCANLKGTPTLQA